jgi:hypothetical protein
MNYIVESWSLNGFPNLQSAIARVKTHQKAISLESYQNIDV